MSYEIPQQLEYKEKIIFGLTFSQLLYAILFLPIALALLFKTALPLPFRITLSLLPCGIAVLFMFTNIPKTVKNWLKWLTWKKYSITDRKMKQYLPIEKIEGGTIKLQ